MGTYEDKRAELRAVAEGGTAGRQAYQEGRQRLVSDQRAALDAALAGPVRFGADTASALESIVRPVGDAGLARMDFAGERHDASMGALDAALSGALVQQGGARALNYDRTLSDARTATDRTIESGEIQRRKAAERAAAAEAERAAREASARTDYSQSEEKMAAEALGGLIHGEQLAALETEQKQKTTDELFAIARDAFSSLPDKRQVSLMMELRENQDNPEAIAELIAKYSPAYAQETQGALSRGFDAIRNIGKVATGQPIPATPVADPGRAAAIERLLGSYIDQDALREQEYRNLETERYLANQDAYTNLFGDPLLAAGIFPQSFDPVAESLEARGAIDQYIASGLTGKDYESAIEEEILAYDTQTAATAGVTPGAVNGAAGATGLNARDLYDLLADPDVGSVVLRAVEDAQAVASSADVTGRPKSKDEIKRGVIAYVTEQLPQGVPDEYRIALAVIAREQFEAIFGG